MLAERPAAVDQGHGVIAELRCQVGGHREAVVEASDHHQALVAREASLEALSVVKQLSKRQAALTRRRDQRKGATGSKVEEAHREVLAVPRFTDLAASAACVACLSRHLWAGRSRASWHDARTPDRGRPRYHGSVADHAGTCDAQVVVRVGGTRALLVRAPARPTARVGWILVSHACHATTQPTPHHTALRSHASSIRSLGSGWGQVRWRPAPAQARPNRRSRRPGVCHRPEASLEMS